MPDWKTTDDTAKVDKDGLNKTDEIAGVDTGKLENEGPENDRHEFDGWKMKDWKLQDWKMTDLFMRHP